MFPPQIVQPASVLCGEAYESLFLLKFDERGFNLRNHGESEGHTNLHWPLCEAIGTEPRATARRYPVIADFDANECVGIEIEALTPAMAATRGDEESWPMRVVTSHRDAAVVYSVFLRLNAAGVTRVADFSSCLEAVDYASAIMAQSWSTGRRLQRGGTIFDLQCVACAEEEEMLYLSHSSQPGIPAWDKDPASALVFHRRATDHPPEVLQALRSKAPTHKCSWLASQVLYSRTEQSRRPEAAGIQTMEVFIGMPTALDLDPSFATLQVNPEFVATLLRMQRLCVNALLCEMRTETTAVRWGSRGIGDVPRTQRCELFVTPTTMRFAPPSSDANHRITTVTLDIAAFVRAVQSHRCEDGILVIDLHGIATLRDA
ncbi:MULTISPECIES: hypothetical protein [Variovorax]|uniref:hypothetical protein n=1 Tax=Variovorax TaxID=34072 RepID=UPI001160047E|nr:hypothetical protein [Variovorax sp. OV084]